MGCVGVRACVRVARQRLAGRIMVMRGERTLPCQAYCQQRSSRLQVANNFQAPLTIAGAPRTILDSIHRTLDAYYTRAGAHAQEARTEIHCEPRREKRSAVNTRTEYDALRSAVIRCGDGSEMFLACGVLQIYSTKESARIVSQCLSSRTRGRKHSVAPIYSS
jgi:hypothetical protein